MSCATFINTYIGHPLLLQSSFVASSFLFSRRSRNLGSCDKGRSPRLMKRQTGAGVPRRRLLLAALLLLSVMSEGFRLGPTDAKGGHGEKKPRAAPNEHSDSDLLKEVYATGSRLPDCLHACGACSPCNRVKLSFKCSMPEPCPMVYRCMCKGKCYPVPST